jgi:hypothetical protein
MNQALYAHMNNKRKKKKKLLETLTLIGFAEFASNLESGQTVLKFFYLVEVIATPSFHPLNSVTISSKKEMDKQ